MTVKERLLIEIQRDLDFLQRDMKHKINQGYDPVALNRETRREVKRLSVVTQPKN